MSRRRRRLLDSAFASQEFQIILAGWQSNMPGGHVTGTGATLSSPADDAQAGLWQWSLNGGGPYGVGGADPNPSNARVLLAASGGGLLYPQTIDANRVGKAYSYMQSVRAATGKPVVVIPFGVGGTSMSEYLAASSSPSNWPANRYNVTKTAYDAFKAAYPNSRVHSIILSVLENEIQNTLGAGNVAGWMDQFVTDIRAFGGTGMATAPIVINSPIWEWLGNTAANRAYVLALAKWASGKANVGFMRPSKGFSVSGDTIHMTNAGNRLEGPLMYSRLATVAALQAAPASAPSVSLTGEQLNLVANGAPYYEVWYRAPAGSGSYTKTEFVAKEQDTPGATLKCTLPGTGGRGAVIIAKNGIGGDSASAPSSGTAEHVTYAVPAVTPPTPVIDIDVLNASVDGSQNITSIPSKGSDVTAWTPESSAGTGATAALKRQAVGSDSALILDATTKSIFRGSAYAFPSGNVSWIMPILYATSPAVGTLIGAANVSPQDFAVSMANAGLNIKAGWNNTTTQLLSVTNFLQFNTASEFWRLFWGTYDRTANTYTIGMDFETVLSGTPTQRASSPANSTGMRFFSTGLGSATNGWSGSTLALGPKVYNAVLSFNEILKIANDIRTASGVTFGYAPS